jgi:hypothetical protein
MVRELSAESQETFLKEETANLECEFIYRRLALLRGGRILPC